MARVLHGESGRIVGGAQVYLKLAEEIHTLLGTFPPRAEAPPTEETREEGTEAEGRIPAENEGREQSELEAGEEIEAREKRVREPSDLAERTDDSFYNEGLRHYNQGHFDEAIPVFEQLIRAYPDSPLADNALYWTGECHFARKRWREALSSFNRVLEEYPFGNKVPAAMLKTSYTQEKLGLLQEAATALERLIERFPQSQEAELGRRKLQLLRAVQQQ